MPNTRTFLKSFSSGEISPEMFGRIDDNKYQQGAATMRNFIAKPQGPAQNRPGFSYVAETKYSTKKTRLIPFRFNVSQTMVIEMGHGYFRFHTQGRPLAYSVAAISQTWNGGSFSTGDIVVYNGVNYYARRANTNVTPFHLSPKNLGSTSTGYSYSSTLANNIITVTTSLVAQLNTGDLLKIEVDTGTAPDEEFVEITVTGNTTFTYETATNVGVNTSGVLSFYAYSKDWYAMPTNPNIYEIPSTYRSEELFDIKHIQSADILTLVHPNHPAKELKRLGAQKWQLDPISFAPTITPPTAVSTYVYTPSDVNNDDGNFQLNTYVVTAVAQDGISESVPSAQFTASNNLFATGAYNEIRFSSIGGAFLYRIYKKQGGIFGFIGEVQQAEPIALTTNTIRDENIAPDFSMTPPQYDEHLVTNFPSAVTYYEQRRVFAATDAEPQTIFMTKSGTESNMSFKLPILDDDRIKFKVAARESNKIKHIVPLTQLLFLTEAAEWRVTSVNSDAITPTSVSVKPQSYIGANDVQPVIVNNSIVYIASRGGHARELGYSFQANGFITGDLSIRATHLFDGQDIVDMQLAKAPIPIVYMVSSSGKLLGFTYVPEQQVGAWHQHDTDGTFESVTTVAEGQIDAVYCVIKRTINGNTKRYIERMGNRDFASQRDSFFVDSGKSYIGTNTNTARTVTITSSGNYTKGSSVTLEFPSTIPVFKFGGNGLTTDLNDAIVIVDGTETYRCDITAIADNHTATVKLARDLPSNLQNTAITSYEIAEKTLFGLTHLIGKTVNILADGAVHPPRVVDSNGSIVLNRAASVVHIGLPYVCDLETLPLMLRTEAGGQGRVKNINHAWLRVNESSGIFVGPTVDKLVEAKQRTTEPYGVAPSLKTKDIKLMLTPTWSENGQIFIRQTDPLPLTVVGITLEVSIGG